MDVPRQTLHEPTIPLFELFASRTQMPL